MAAIPVQKSARFGRKVQTTVFSWRVSLQILGQLFSLVWQKYTIDPPAQEFLAARDPLQLCSFVKSLGNLGFWEAVLKRVDLGSPPFSQEWPGRGLLFKMPPKNTKKFGFGNDHRLSKGRFLSKAQPRTSPSSKVNFEDLGKFW